MDSRLRGNDGGKAVKRGSAKRKPNPTQAKARQAKIISGIFCVFCVPFASSASLPLLRIPASPKKQPSSVGDVFTRAARVQRTH